MLLMSQFQQKKSIFSAEFSILSITKKNNEIHNLIFIKNLILKW